ncbi:DUF6232 family protein [Streptomyces sp. NPDC056486]|uniref:DUF6232 family protein n=1 Tax=Streptomyces sp. NPDC056486 TaxID=3345835 RepID=UPI0036C2997C
MTLSHKAVEVQISDGSLWVGGEAYPLRNITRVGQRRQDIDKGAVWKRFIIRALLAVIFGGILPALLGTVGVALLCAVLALVIWRFVAALRTPSVYGLVISTSGTQTDAVWSTDKGEIDHLVTEITRAIGSPDAAHMIFNVQNAVHNGDVVNQYGPGIGKATHHGAGHIMGG